MQTCVEKPRATQLAGSPKTGATARSGLPLGHGRNLILPLQQTIGHPGVAQSLQDRAGAREAAFTSTASPRFEQNFGRVSIHPPGVGAMQMKPAVSEPGRPDEQATLIHAGPRSPGQPLDQATQDRLAPRFGHDFSAVRVHVGAQAAHSARAVAARAYTIGQDIVFGQGAFAPGTAEGARLLAHELTHVVQQRRGVALPGGIGQAGDRYERQADAVADRVVAGRSAAALLDPGPAVTGNPGTPALQREEPTTAPTPAPVDQQAAAPVVTEGEKMRKAVLAAAERRLKEKTTIVSEADIQDIQTGRIRLKLVTLPDGSETYMNIPTATPVKNFTTCIEFAGQTIGDASKVVGKDTKDAQRIAALLPGILKIFNQEFSLNAQIEAFQKAVMAFNKPIADVEKRQEGFANKMEELEGQKTGEKVHDRGIDQAIKGQNSAIRQLDSAIATMEREQKKFEAKVQKLQGDYAVLDAQDDALVRATAPLSGHPKPGEYILLGAGAAQAYGVSEATKVTLAKGSFKHIAVFRSSEPVPSPKDKPGEKWEKWRTIDGGGTAARASEIYVCLSDLRVQFADPDKPWASSKTALIGWIDMDKLLAGGANQGGAAPPAR